MALGKKLFKGAAGGVTNTDNFDVVTYAGTNNTNSITSLDFQPDLVWVKNRDNANDHFLTDSVRGAGKYVSSNTTNAEDTTNRFNSFDSNGFTVSTDTSLLNNLAYDYIAWCWKGGGSAVSNTDGSITSTVSANPDAGFSIVKYTSTGTNGSTIGHGLSSNPDLVIIKSTTNTTNWIIYNSISGDNYYLSFNTSAQQFASSWLQTPTGVFKLNNTFSDANTNGRSYIAYCFHSVDGYQKVGSYTGATGGVTENIGFQPRWIMIKDTTDSINHWVINDAVRDISNPRTAILFPNLSNAEGDNIVFGVNFTSTGFEIPSTTTSTAYNKNGNTYIYLAIA